MLTDRVLIRAPMDRPITRPARTITPPLVTTPVLPISKIKQANMRDPRRRRNTTSVWSTLGSSEPWLPEPMHCMRSMRRRRIRRTLGGTRSRRRSLLRPLWVVVGMRSTSITRRRKTSGRPRKLVASIATISSKLGLACC
uniref:Uncharacterized protein n=1 Tax=Picea sitchensis TaxID=3332 RepID=A9NLP0_PICSI|nr:unknown [Picea sitchensis]